MPDDAVVTLPAGEGLERRRGRALEAGAPTAAVTARYGSPPAVLVDVAIEAPVGDEVVSGSTRHRDGTALMVRRGRTIGGLMAGMRVSNTKLRGALAEAWPSRRTGSARRVLRRSPRGARHATPDDGRRRDVRRGLTRERVGRR